MFFVLGSTLEYTKHAEYIVAGITLIFGILKTYVRKIYFSLNIDWMHILSS
jgi:hypothetical protein